MLKTKNGFTIVELLIVIVVIGILAAITIVAYNGIQQRGRDAQRRSDIEAIAKALHLYQVDKGPMYTGSGCGADGDGSGWFNYSYPLPGSDMNECLKSGKYLSATIKDPNNVTSCSTGELTCRKYMKYTCVQSGSVITYLYANLEAIDHASTDTDGTCRADLDTSYGMNYFAKIGS